MRIHLLCHHEGTPLDNHLKAPVRGTVRSQQLKWGLFLKPCKTVLKDMSKSHHHITSTTVSCQQLCANFTYWHKYHWKDLFFFIRKNRHFRYLQTLFFSKAPALLLEECCMESQGLKSKTIKKLWLPRPGEVQLFENRKRWSAFFWWWFFPTRLFEKYVRQICVQISPDDSLWFMMVLTQDSQTLERSPKKLAYFQLWIITISKLKLSVHSLPSSGCAMNVPLITSHH